MLIDTDRQSHSRWYKSNSAYVLNQTIHWLESHENQKEHYVVTSRFSHPVVMMGCTLLL